MEDYDSLDWNDLKYFLAVARGNGLTPAAAALRTSVSTVSRHINALEARLGVKLFVRQQRGYLLTDDGSALFARVEDVERAMQAVERNREMLGGGEVSGWVRIATTELLASTLVAPALGELARRYPRIRVELVAGRALADLSRREADIALRIAADDPWSHQPDYIAHPIGVMRMALYGSPEFIQRAGNADWRTLPYITWDESWARGGNGHWLSHAFPDREPVVRANLAEAQYAAARAGVGMALVPCYVGDADPRLQRIVDIAPRVERIFWLVYHRDMKASRRLLAVRDFLDELVRRVAVEEGAAPKPAAA